MRFLLTKELGRLAKWLRILGYDARYYTGENLSSVIIEALRDSRIILTRNHRLAGERAIKIMLIKQEKIKEQINELMRELGIKPEPEMMFNRCVVCNEGLVGINKEEVKDKVPEYVFRSQENFITCPKCKRIYWRGTHWGNVQKMLEEITG